jgi:hypothetical protein
MPTVYPNTASIISFGEDQPSDLQKLQSAISQDPDILDILDVAADWFISWRDLAWALRGDDPQQSLRTFVKGRLAHDNPVIYASGLLCLALALQQLRPGQDDQNIILSASPADLMERITTAVDQVILTRYIHDETTILVCLQRAKIHAEGNQLRKSWLRIRQAIILLQQSKFANNSAVAEDELIHRQRWAGSIYEMDSFMSMILGFPHAVDKNFTDHLAMNVLHSPQSGLDLRMRAVRRIVAVAAGQINDRNAEGNLQHPTVATRSIQATLDNAAAAMPRDWWDIKSHVQNVQAKVGYEHLTTQLWFWQIQSFLHLPHMLEANVGEDIFNSSRCLCLQGARSMLGIYCGLRGTPSLSVYLCSCDDFQGVLTACILLIGLLLPISHGTYTTDSNFLEDFELLHEVKGIFRYRAHKNGNSISIQGLKAVETLETFLMDEQEECKLGRTCSIILPYFGLINVESKRPLHVPGKDTSDSSAIHSMGLSKTQESPATTEGDRSTPKISGVQPFEAFDFGSISTPLDVDWDLFLHGDELGQNWDLGTLGFESQLEPL